MAFFLGGVYSPSVPMLVESTTVYGIQL